MQSQWPPSFQPALLHKKGIDMALMRPKEGIITWIDGLVYYKDHPGMRISPSSS
jgi:hypothetical protein